MFEDQWICNPIELALSCIWHANLLIDKEEYLKAIPFTVLSDYLSTDILMSPYYSIRSKILKSIAISNLGYLNDAY
jgi:hypothetical protein